MVANIMAKSRSSLHLCNERQTQLKVAVEPPSQKNSALVFTTLPRMPPHRRKQGAIGGKAHCRQRRHSEEKHFGTSMNVHARSQRRAKQDGLDDGEPHESAHIDRPRAVEASKRRMKARKQRRQNKQMQDMRADKRSHMAAHDIVIRDIEAHHRIPCGDRHRLRDDDHRVHESYDQELPQRPIRRESEGHHAESDDDECQTRDATNPIATQHHDGDQRKQHDKEQCGRAHAQN